ncbi:MAG: hypothetical protein WBQ08_08725 [Candidatus Sulfotelmatobacter sp.]
MFETLEDRIENKKPLDRGYPILMFGISAIVSSIALILVVRGHGFSHLFSLVVWAAAFLLSLTWLVTSLRSSAPMTRRDFRVRSMVLLWLLLAQDLLTFIWR